MARAKLSELKQQQIRTISVANPNSARSDRTMRYAPRNMEQVRWCLEDQPDDRMVKAGPDSGVTEKTIGEVRARTTWPPSLILVVPREPWLTVELVKVKL